MPEPHVHAELIKAWADGALIEQKSKYDNSWKLTIDLLCSDGNMKFRLCSDGNMKFRILPACDYALAKIAELASDDMVELYLYWLDGGELEFSQSNGEYHIFTKDEACISPFDIFIM